MNEWKKVLLGEISEIQGGLQVTSKRNPLPVEVPYLRVANVHRNHLDLDEIKKIRLTEQELGRTLLEKGDLLVVEGHGNPNEIGRVAMWDGSISPCVHQNHLIRVRLNSRAIPAFIAALLNSPEGRLHLLRSASTTSGLNTISTSDVRTAPLMLPPLEEQRRIAEALDQADELRAKRRRAISLLDDLAQSTFHSMFMSGSEFERSCYLGEVAEIASGITKGRKLPGGVTQRDVPYLAVANVQDKKLDLSTVKTIEASQGEIDRYRLLRNDLLLTEGGDPDKLGRGTLWDEELPEAIHQNHIFRVRLNKASGVNPVYLNWYVGSDTGKRYFLRSAKQTTGIASINATQLKNFPLAIPPMQLQDSFASRIAKIRNAHASQQASLRVLDELFAAVQVKAFRGELWQT